MGCFLGCFGASKDDKKRHKNAHISHPPPVNNFVKQYSPIHQTVAPKQELLEEPINLPVPESTWIETEEEKLNLTNQAKEEEQNLGARKRVTFDSNVKEYEHVSSNEGPEIIEENEIGADSNCTKPGNSSPVSESGSTLSSLGSYPSNHRYQNCRESDDEDDELDCEVSDLDEDEDEHDEDDDEEAYDAEYSDDEYYSRQMPEISGSCSSMESGTKNLMTSAVNDRHVDEPNKDYGSHDKETNTPPVFYRGARDRAGYVHSVLNPVENTAQWKDVKAKQTPRLKQQKENFQMDLGSNQSFTKSKSKLDNLENKYDVAVDASLSTWLDSSQKTPPIKAIPIGLDTISSSASLSSQGSNSVKPQDERPILGALTMAELKQHSASSSPRRSPSRSPNEKPLVGTVGVHWNHKNYSTPIEDSGSASSFKGIPNTTSKYREDNRVNWHSTPFETRLERALNRGAADSRF